MGYGSLNLFMCNFKLCIIIIILVIELNKESVIYIAKKIETRKFLLEFFFKLFLYKNHQKSTVLFSEKKLQYLKTNTFRLRLLKNTN